MGYGLCVKCGNPCYSEEEGVCDSCICGYPSSLKCVKCETRVESTVRDGISRCQCGVYLCKNCKICEKCELSNLGSDSEVDLTDSECEFDSFHSYQEYCEKLLQKAQNDVEKCRKLYANALKKLENLKTKTEKNLTELESLCDSARENFELQNPNNCESPFCPSACNCFDEAKVVTKFLNKNSKHSHIDANSKH